MPLPFLLKQINNMECLNNLVGISQTECECTAAGLSDGDKISKSGIYVDEVEGGLNMSALESMDCQTYAEKARKALKRAIDMFVEQILGIYATEPYKRKFRPFNNRIGKINNLRALNVPQFAGMRLRAGLIRGAYLTVNKIGLIIDQESNVTVRIFKGYRDGELTDNLIEINAVDDIQTIANLPSIKELPSPLKLPLFDENLMAIDYYFVYDTVLYGNPRDNGASCTCGGSEAILKTYLKPEGVAASAIGGLSKSSSTYAHGIFIDGKIECTMREIICDLIQLDESNTIPIAIAYKTQELLIEDIMASGNINRYTMLSKEHLWGKRNHFRKEFDDRVIWITQKTPIEELTDCLICNDDRISKVLIGGTR